MKKFKELTVGDKFFKVSKNPSEFLNKVESTGTAEHSIIQEIEIKKIEKRADRILGGDLVDNYYFNQTGGMNSIQNWALKMSEEVWNSTKYNGKNHWFFADRKDYYQMIRATVLAEIVRTQEAARKSQIHAKERVIALRAQYGTQLNMKS